MRVTALAGGVGGAKLLVGLQRALAPGELTAVVNTGDDAIVYGVHVSPDVDIVTYWLAGVADVDRGWGLRGDTFVVVDALAALGVRTWFRLGDRDLATCLFRSERLASGSALSSVSEEIRIRLGVPSRILPMSDDPVRTFLDCADGRSLEFQEYFVRERTKADVVGVRYAGMERARPAPGVAEAIASADVVIVCPSNPILSVAPILSLARLRELLRAHPRVVAVSPIVAGRALKGPADRLLSRLGHDPSATGVARLYRDFCDVFVLDSVDAAQCEQIAALGPRALATGTVMGDAEASERLAREVLAG